MIAWPDLHDAVGRTDRATGEMTTPPRSRWVGRALSAIVIVLLAADAAAQLLSIPMLRAEMAASGVPFSLSPVIGTITAICVVLYAVPSTATLGAITLTGFLGGAICLHLRLGEIGSLPQVVCLVLGATAWAGLYLRDPRLRALIPLRR